MLISLHSLILLVSCNNYWSVHLSVNAPHHQVCGDTVEIQNCLKFGSTLPRLLKVRPLPQFMLACYLLMIVRFLCMRNISIGFDKSYFRDLHFSFFSLESLSSMWRLSSFRFSFSFSLCGQSTEGDERNIPIC